MSVASARQATTSATGSVRKTRLLTVGGGVVAAVLIWGIAQLAGMDLRQPALGPGEAPMALTIVPVIAASAIASLAGWGLLALLERFTAKARAVWTTISVIFVVLSFAGPFSGEGITTGNRLVLALMHVVVGAIVITGLARTARGKN
jgi:Family of unknown function (DUF6069)